MKTEFNEIANPATLCRVCMAAEEDHFSNLYEESPSGQPPISLHEMLQVICAPVFTSSDSSDVPEMPTRVCNVCRDAIIAAFNLHQQCIESDRRLGELLTFEKEFEFPKSNEELEDFPTTVVVNEIVMPTEDAGDVSKTCSEHKRTGSCAGTDPKMFPCRLCDKAFNTPNALQGHRRKCHGSNADSVIWAPEAEFCSEDKMASEERKADEVTDGPSMSSENMVMIKVEALDLMDDNGHENRSFNSAENITVKTENEPTVQRITTADTKTCSVCSETVEDTSKLKTHMRSCHQLYLCEICSAVFLTRHVLWYHTLKHKEPNVTCSVCGKKLSSKYNLELHMLRHAGKKMHACELCSMRFTTSGAKAAHLRIHKKERPFVCDICGKRVVSKASLAKHVKEIHENIRRFVCSVCTRRFTTKSHLSCHMLTHTKEKPYKCKLCPQAYSQTTDLVRHVSRAHWSGKPYPCDRCDESFRLIEGLREHYRVHVQAGEGMSEMAEDKATRRTPRTLLAGVRSSVNLNAGPGSKHYAAQ
ncbi:hypothetical protein pipiens_015496 [Culex pipiens pipiens]|uniref:Uncharacterized protein n=1 Tax=Culex pipiens pipiens TaxID=38569 RepID=A0ABD1CQC0_CULPP